MLLHAGVLIPRSGATRNLRFVSCGVTQIPLALRGIGMVSDGDADLLEANLPRFEPLTLKLSGRALLSDVMASAHNVSNPNEVSAGAGKVMATGGGVESASVMRFTDKKKRGPFSVHLPR